MANRIWKETPRAIVYSDLFLAHQPGPNHPERPERLVAARRKLEEVSIWSRSRIVEPRPATDEELLRVHTAEHLAHVRSVAAAGGGLLDDGDTAMSAGSLDAALLAAGGAIVAADLVATGEARSAFALVRPPGHHATRDAAMGFCIFNNVAVAARHLQQVRGLSRILIFDFDLHHGNGTQEIFWRDGGVFYVSLHRWPFYPSTGRREETGEGPGAGLTLNLPLRTGCGSAEYLAAARWALSGPVRDFAPEFVLVSAGFDAHADDPLGGLGLDAGDYRALAREFKGVTSAGGRIASVLEGGYDLARGLPDSLAAYLEELTRD
jgi:acetoin utilization deacetylase AcuC-like enzyme